MATSVADIEFDNGSIESSENVTVEAEDDDVPTGSLDYDWSTYCSSTSPQQ